MHTRSPGRSAAPWCGSAVLMVIAQWLACLFRSPKLIPVRVSAVRRPLRRTPLLALPFLLAVSGLAWADGVALTLPDGVPDLHDPQVLAKYVPVQVGIIGGNPDLPMVMLVSQAEEGPEAVLVGLDARNGKSTWSLLSDPIVLIALFENPTTITQLDVDPGFLSQGEPSGSFERVPDPRLETLPDLLRSIALVPARTFL